MYIPKHFKIDDQEVIYDFIEKYGFALLFSQHYGEPCATHLPLMLNKTENALYAERQELIIKNLENTDKQENIQVASLMRKNLQK